MAQLAALAPYIQAGATVLSTYATVKQGMDAKTAAERVALQREREGKDAQVEAQVLATRERKKTRYLRSRALAVAGASGAGVSDPTVSSILTGIDTEGEMSALTALWNGDTTNAGLRASASAERSQGRAAMRSGLMSGGVKALTGFSEFADNNPGFFKKYGGDRAEKMGMGTGFSDYDQMGLSARGLA